MDGLYVSYALRLPNGGGPHPFVFVAYGNGSCGMAWLRDRGLLMASVAAEPAVHDLLTLGFDDVPTVASAGGLRDIESLETGAPNTPRPG